MDAKQVEMKKKEDELAVLIKVHSSFARVPSADCCAVWLQSIEHTRRLQFDQLRDELRSVTSIVMQELLDLKEAFLRRGAGIPEPVGERKADSVSVEAKVPEAPGPPSLPLSQRSLPLSVTMSAMSKARGSDKSIGGPASIAEVNTQADAEREALEQSKLAGRPKTKTPLRHSNRPLAR